MSSLKQMSRTQLVIVTAVIFLILGGGIVYFALQEKPDLKEKKNEIPMKDADAYMRGHSGKGFNWRANTNGVWYDTTQITQYIQKLKEAIKVIEPIPGYTWKISIMFGGATKPHNKKDGLMTMFLPVLVKEGSKECVIDLITAWRYRTAEDQTTRPNCGNTSAQYTYYYVYEKVFGPLLAKMKQLGTCPGPDCIVYDEGNMFP
jgi:hypothetical protein